MDCVGRAVNSGTYIECVSVCLCVSVCVCVCLCVLVVNIFVYYKHDDDTSKHALNLSNYNKDGSPEAPFLTLPGYSWRRKRHAADKGGVDAIYLAFDNICLSDF
jgi:hypothetical protein